jgi:uncharacterized protein (TIGR03083 family)
MASLHPPKYLELLRRSIDDMTALSTGNLDVAVSDCPGWKISDLLGHVGQVFAMVDAIVIPRSQVRVGPGDEIRPADGQDVLEWFAARAGSVLNTLENTDPSETLWTWSDRQDAGFYFRRMANEVAVHVCDLQRALSLPIEMDRSLACDGIDELYIDMMTGWAKRFGKTFPQGSLHLHCTDGEGEWLIVPSDERVVVTHEHAKGDVAWRGSAVALVLSSWGRANAGIEIYGDAEISDQWLNFAP